MLQVTKFEFVSGRMVGVATLSSEAKGKCMSVASARFFDDGTTEILLGMGKRTIGIQDLDALCSAPGELKELVTHFEVTGDLRDSKQG